MTVRDATQARDQYMCLRCADPRQEALPSLPATCFELTSKKTGSPRERLDAAAASSKSMIQIHRSDTQGKVTADLYEFTHLGRPVTTQTLAHLCGGYAPYIWSPKKLESTMSSVSKGDSIVITTADDGMYIWDTHMHAFDLWGTKRDYLLFQPHFERLKQKMKNGVAYWLWSGGVRCYWDEFKYQVAALFETHGRINEPALSQISQHCTTIRQSEVDPQWDLINDLFTEIGDLVAKQYVERTQGAPSFLFCPESTEHTLALYNGDTHSIYFYLNLLDDLTMYDVFGKEQFHIVQAVAAHEVGHYRHLIEAGVGEKEETGVAIDYGLPMSIVHALGEVMDELNMPLACDAQYLEALRQKHGFLVPTSSWHAPTTTEMIAMLYEMDQIMKNGAPPKYEDSSLQQCLDIAHTLARYYKTFPDVAFDLSRLYALVMLDPKLGPATKELGFSMMKEIIRQLPSNAMLDYPVDCNATVDRAGLSDARRAQLPSNWCDFPAFARRIRREMSR